MNAPELVTGASASVTLVVTEADTALALGSGSVAVLGTPRLLALCEQASVEALRNALADGTTSVGVQVMLDHVKPSPIGCEVRAEATLERIKGRKLFFTTSAHDERGLIAAGKVVRVVVDTSTFLQKCERP
jgi:fluoroacetyl-CoA thioesterase